MKTENPPTRAGRYITQQASYKAFIPSPLPSSLPREMPLIISLGQGAPGEKRSFCLTPLIRALSLDKSQPQA